MGPRAVLVVPLIRGQQVRFEGGVGAAARPGVRGVRKWPIPWKVVAVRGTPAAPMSRTMLSQAAACRSRPSRA